MAEIFTKYAIYRLTLEHFIRSDKDGRINLEEPFCVEMVVDMAQSGSAVFVLNEMLDRMRTEVLKNTNG